MKKALMALAIVLTVAVTLGSMVTGLTLAASPGALPPMGLMVSSRAVTAVNLAPVYIEYRSGPSPYDGMPRQYQMQLAYGDRCWMRGDSTFMLVGRQDERVLVRSLQTMIGTLPDDGPVLCNDQVYFWVTATEFTKASEAYVAAERQKRRNETPEERDKRIIRRLLDEQYDRK